MALKIRLRQQGRTNRATYRLVVTDSRNPRDGKYVEALGWYNPIESELEKMLFIKEDRIQHWLDVGAQLSERAATLIARTAPNIIRSITAKEVARRAKKAEKRKATA
ncbi:MAG: 30S ribosomal protein S16 [Parachlamydiaceae bacterium]|nr:30S ribosomal protein S16 [Parachlamydiaceae bacterium]